MTKMKEIPTTLAKCLICYNSFPQVSAEPPPVEDFKANKNKCQQKSLISKHLDVIFILKNILDLPSNQLVEYLRHCPNIENWIITCDNCEHLINKTKVVYKELLHITKEFRATKQAVVDIVRNSYHEDNHVDGDTCQEEAACLDIVAECRRHFINQYKYSNLLDPFIKGDAKAVELLKATSSSSISVLAESVNSNPGGVIGKEELIDREENFEHDYNDDGRNDDADWEPSETEDLPQIADFENEGSCSKTNGKVQRKKTTGTKLVGDCKKKTYKSAQCTICEKVFYGSSSLYRHKARVHGIGQYYKRQDKKPVKCTNCEKVLCDTWSLKQHKAMVHGIGQYNKQDRKTVKCTCTICGKVLCGTSSLKQHKAAIHGVGQYKKQVQKSVTCTICDKVLCEARYLKKHMAMIHGIGEYKKQEENVQCTLCGKVLTSKYTLKKHQELIHGIGESKKQVVKTKKKYLKKEFPCSICGKIVSSKVMLKYHEATHQPEQIKCIVDQCKEIFSSHRQLEIHCAAQHGEKSQLKCDQCGKGFFTEEAMKTHKSFGHRRITNEDNAKFTCEHCSSKFSTRDSLKTHKSKSLQCKLLYQSESELTIVCEQCGKKFAHQKNLDLHIKTVHERIYLINCEHCGKGFNMINMWKIHLYTVHKIGDGGPGYTKCPEEGCERRFQKKRRLEDHLTQHRGQPGYSCEICGKQFYFLEGLKNHKSRVHSTEGSVNCNVCGTVVASHYLKTHMSQMHRREPLLNKRKGKGCQKPGIMDNLKIELS